MKYRGRFAPSPSGHLHMGSLLAAVASYADAKHNNGDWFLRIDNIDTTRISLGSESSILYSLEALGFKWDGHIRHQDNYNQYQEALNYLLSHQHAYPCQCSRSEIYKLNNQGIYSGICRSKRININNSVSIRINTQNRVSQFKDIIQGNCGQNLEAQGDFIIRRSDKIISYHLAAIIDDYLDNITHVVRAHDLIDSSLKQTLLLKHLHLPVPTYAHIPILINNEGIKLSKRSGANAVTNSLLQLYQAAKYLGQQPDKALLTATFRDFWQEIINNWDIRQVPKCDKISEL
ncbi:MAG: tRNA glutamyl-Q(34) synthetase GluQRS [Gammaproteobacteria bacterium]|nr:tRNA glutamyl-Q(34) synthetase GluQRS [Gammaproteobacteria bacterium]